jgi:hypothetical protein
MNIESLNVKCWDDCDDDDGTVDIQRVKGRDVQRAVCGNATVHNRAEQIRKEKCEVMQCNDVMMCKMDRECERTSSR